MRSTLLAAMTLLNALVWVVALLVDSGPFQTAPALAIGVGILTTATVATVGMIVVGGRWAHRLSLGSLAMTVVVAVVREVDPLWVVATLLLTTTLLALFSPTLTATIRKRPSASGPPPEAITPALLLLVSPALLGFVGNNATPWALLVVALTAPNVAFVYSRVIPGGLIGIRFIWPVLTMALTPLLGWVAGSVAAALAMSVAVSAWQSSVKASYHPPQESGTRFPIPPELAPREVLDAADIDEKGRRR